MKFKTIKGYLSIILIKRNLNNILMKSLIILKSIVLFFLLSTIATPFSVQAQGKSKEKKMVKRIKRPKRPSKIGVVDSFVDYSFNIYNKVYIYDSLSIRGVKIPTELEDAIINGIEQDADSLLQIIPEVIDAMEGEKTIRLAKAMLSLNKVRRVLTYSVDTAKLYALREIGVGEGTTKN